MILEAIFSVFISFISFAFSFLPALDFLVIPVNLVPLFRNLVVTCYMFLPFPALFSIFSAWLIVINARFVYAVVMRILKLVRG